MKTNRLTLIRGWAAALLLAVALLPQAAAAYDFMVDGLCYNRNSDGTSVTVTYENSSKWPSYSNLSGDLVIPASVIYSGTTYSVTSIGYSAFEGCSGLTSVTIPNSVTSIGSSTFSGCRGLTSVTIPNSVTSIGYSAFEGCSGLTSVTIPNSVTSIGGWAFSGCSGLTSVTIPNSVTSIGDGAFPYCSGLESMVVEAGNTKYDSRDNCNAIIETASNTLVAGCKNTTIGNSVTSIGGWAFSGCSGLTSVTIPNSVTSIGYYAFEDCSGLTEVTIGNSVTSIGGGAFDGCSGLTSVTIPNSVTSIGNYAFRYCSGLTSVTIPNSVTSIGGSAFEGCSGLTGELTIPNSVTTIGGSAFYRCSGLTSVTIGNSVTSIGSYAFANSSGLTSVTWNAKNCPDFSSSSPFSSAETSITSFTFGEQVEKIPAYLCYKMTGLTSVTIPNSVTSIGSRAFSGCSGLESMVVEAGNTKYDSRDNCNAIIETATNTLIAGCKATTIPNSVTSINDYAFYGCSGLTSVTIPNSVTSIGNYAFKGCSGLELIHSEISDPANVQLGSTVFDNVPKSTCVLVVPAASLESYQSTSPWNEFTNIFAEMTSFSISEQSFELMIRKKQVIDVMTQPDNSWNQFVWTSSDNFVATVDGNGTVTAVSPGTATITAKYILDSNLSDSCLVTVIPSCDVNDDDKVDIADVGLLINKMLEKNGALSMEYTDINGDSIVDIFDINEVISVMLGNGNLPEPPSRTQTYTVNGVSFNMIVVDGGTFTMGATPEQGSDAYSDEKPAHQVTLSNYSIGQTEVTQELWQAVMGSNPSYFTGDLQRPVERVRWNDCQTFITKLNQLTGENFRLPTEAEWEYAARGGNQSQDYKFAGSSNIDDVAWYYDNSYALGSSHPDYGTHAVATKAPNELGLYDMSGNVCECCQDRYGSYSSDAQTNPTGPTSGSQRVYRGGGWYDDAGCCRVSFRSDYAPSYANSFLGLRLAL